jgi:hypothetical protein
VAEIAFGCSPDRIHNTEGQPLAYVYSRGSEAEARWAKMLIKDEARRIAVKVTRLPESPKPRLSCMSISLCFCVILPGR